MKPAPHNPVFFVLIVSVFPGIVNNFVSEVTSLSNYSVTNNKYTVPGGATSTVAKMVPLSVTQLLRVFHC